jgi:hypothetical protein
MDPAQGWTLIAFLSLMTAALLLLDLGMRRAHTSARRRGSDDLVEGVDHVGRQVIAGLLDDDRERALSRHG